MLTFAALIALCFALSVLHKTVRAWLDVESGRITSDALVRLTGCDNETALIMRFGLPDADGRWQVTIRDVLTMQTRTAEAYADPLINALNVTLMTVALFSQNPVLMATASVFACLWYGVGPGTALIADSDNPRPRS